jgi:hypothetical protein
VAGVVAALVAGDNIKRRGEKVNDFAFPFVSPLSPEDDDIGHTNPSSQIDPGA